MDLIKYRSYEDLCGLIRSSIHHIEIKPDLVVGVPRSGMVPAYLIALHFNLPVMDLPAFLARQSPVGGTRLKEFDYANIKNILIVDDSIQFGRQTDKVKQNLSGLTEFTFYTLAVYGSEENTNKVDYVFEIIPSPRVFEWNLLHSWVYEYSCVDIDGVLCVDPSDEENDDGPQYQSFLLNAQPKYIPPVPVHTLVTSRLEKYRHETETWLRKNGIRYNNLVMLDLPDKATRVQLGNHARHKAESYMRYPETILFVESSIVQAKTIHELSGRAVFSVEGMQFFPAISQKKKEKHVFLYNLFRSLKNWMKNYL